MAEEKHGVVRARLGTTDFDLFFTNERVIAAKTGGMMGWALALGAIGQAIAAHLSKKKSEQLRDLSLESVVTSDSKNFCISHDDVLRAELKKPKALSVGKLTINTGSKAYKFLLMDKKLFDLDETVIKQCFGDKVACE